MIYFIWLLCVYHMHPLIVSLASNRCTIRSTASLKTLIQPCRVGSAAGYFLIIHLLNFHIIRAERHFLFYYITSFPIFTCRFPHFQISLISSFGMPITLQCSSASPSIIFGSYSGLIGTIRSQSSPFSYSTFFKVATSSS